MNKNIHKIIELLESKGNNKDYIIGYLSAIVQHLSDMHPNDSEDYFQRALQNVEKMESYC